MTDRQDWEQGPQYPQGSGQPWPQDAPWGPEQYDPGAHQRRLGGQQNAPQGQPWFQPGAGQPPYPGQQLPQGPPGWQQPGYGQLPPYQPQYVPGPAQPPQPPRRRKRHTGRNVVAGIGGLIVLIIALTVANNHGSGNGAAPAATASAAAQAAQSSPSAAAPAVPASPTPAPPTKVEFIVSGTAPDGIDITYGPAGSNFSGPSTLDGTATMSVPFDGSADYYALNAQLQGGGSITCKIVVTGPGDSPLTVSSGAASGGFNICEAQAAPADSTGLSWTNEQ